MAHRFATTDALAVRTWQAELWSEMQERDIFSGLVGTYNDKAQTIPDAPIMRVNLEKGSYRHTIGLLKELTGSGRQGAGVTLKGHTETLVTRKFDCYANDVRHGVNAERFGLFAHMNEKYALLEQNNALLTRWFQARKGKHMRQALLENCSDNLELSPTSLTSGWNKNWLIKNVAWSSQPSYDSALATFTGNLITALSGCGYSSTDSVLDANFFTDLEHYITDIWKIEPFNDGTYIVTIPSRQAVYIKRLNSSGESLADMGRLTNDKRYIDSAYGQNLFQIGRLRLIVDNRNPIVNYNTTAGSLTAYYRDVGTTDDRASYTPSSVNRVFDIGFVLGKKALTETWAMKPREDEEVDDIGRLLEIGYSMTYGFQGTEFDADTQSDTSRINQSSAVIAMYAGSPTA